MNEANDIRLPTSVETECAKGHSDQRLVRRREIVEAISAELNRAYFKHGCEQWGRHEFYAILKEEVDELWDAIKADEPQDRVVAEALQVAAMCFRYIETRDRYREPSNDKSSATGLGDGQSNKLKSPKPSALLGQFAIELKNDPPDGTELWGAYESEALAREVATAFIANDSTWRVVPVTTDMEFSGCPM